MNSRLRPQVGVGVLIFNNKGEVLLGQRSNSHGDGDYGPPGGHLEFGESFEECAIREVKEEIGVELISPQFLSVTNDVFIDDNKHYISIFMQGILPEGQQIVNMEPYKILGWEWFDIDKLPENLFLPLKNLVASGKLNEIKV